MSVTREQVAARELAAKFDFECTGSDDHDLDNCNKCAGMREDLEKVVARALAACALESFEEAAQIAESYAGWSSRAKRIAAAIRERAAGEKS